MSAARVGAVLVAALAAGGVVVALELTSDHRDAKVVWAVFGPAVGWSFVGTGLYASRRDPESRIGVADDPARLRVVPVHARRRELAARVHVRARGGRPVGRAVPPPRPELPDRPAAHPRLDRALVLAGYVVFPFASVPALLFADPEQLGCSDCPSNLLLIRSDDALAAFFTAFGALLYFVLFVVVLTRAIGLWRRRARSSGCS